MGFSFQEAVRKIVTDFTIDILLDAPRFCAMLGDLAPRQQKECKTVKFAFEFGIGKEIVEIQSLPVSERPFGRARIERKMTEDIGLSSDRVVFLLENLFDPLAWIGVSEHVIEAYNKANGGNAVDEFEYGKMLFEGKEAGRDIVEAVRWFKSASDKGMVEAQHKLGVLYAIGVGVEKDYHKAYEYTEAAAKQNLLASVYNLAILIANGVGTDVNERKAVEELHFASEHGFAKAMNKLGWFYEHGIGVAADAKKAAELYKRAFVKSADDPEPYENLARLYEQGAGVEHDMNKAGQLRSLAAKRAGAGWVNGIKELIGE
jgi:TPR repeat protein